MLSEGLSGAARGLHGGICPWSAGCRADYGEGVGGAPNGGVEKPVVPVLVSPSRKDGDDLSAVKEARTGLRVGTGYLAEFAAQWNSIELAWCHFRRRMIHPITVPNDEVASPRAMTWATYKSRLGIPEGIMKVDPIQRSVGTGKEKAQHLRNLATSQ